MNTNNLIQTCLRLAAIAALLASSTIAWSAEPPGRAPAPRPGLFWEEVWEMENPGEHPLTQADVANPDLVLKIYGLKGEEGIMINGVQGSDTNPPHTWSGVCGAGCTFAFSHRDSYADLGGAARIMVQSKTSGFHKIHPFVKLADGTTWVGDFEFGQTADFLFTEFRLDGMKWLTFNTETGVTRGNLQEIDLSRVDEIGFTDLQPGAGHGNGGWSDVGAIRVFASAVPR